MPVARGASGAGTAQVVQRGNHATRKRLATRCRRSVESGHSGGWADVQGEHWRGPRMAHLNSFWILRFHSSGDNHSRHLHCECSVWQKKLGCRRLAQCPHSYCLSRVCRIRPQRSQKVQALRGCDYGAGLGWVDHRTHPTRHKVSYETSRFSLNRNQPLMMRYRPQIQRMPHGIHATTMPMPIVTTTKRQISAPQRSDHQNVLISQS